MSTRTYTVHRSADHYLICQSLKSGKVYTDTQLAKANGIPRARVAEITRELCRTYLDNGMQVYNVTEPGQRVQRWQALTEDDRRRRFAVG